MGTENKADVNQSQAKDELQSQTKFAIDDNSKKIIAGLIALLLVVVCFFSWQIGSLKKKIAALSVQSNNIPPQGTMVIPMPQIRFSEPDYWGNFGSAVSADPLEEMVRIQRQINRMFRDAFGRVRAYNGFGWFSRKNPFDLDTDIKETKNSYIIKMDIPGMDKENINVETKGHMLVVSGQRNEVDENKGNHFFKRERRFGYFARSLPLPEDADLNSVQADYKRGVLTITIHKKQKNLNTTTKTNKININ